MKNGKEWGELVETADGSLTLRHPERQEEYHSSQGARFEAEQLYIRGSGIDETLAKAGTSLGVLDVGLGLAYNAMATITQWWNSPPERDIYLHSLELNLDLVEALANSSAPWLQGWPQEWIDWAAKLQFNGQLWQMVLPHPKNLNVKLTWTIYIGDAAIDKNWNPNGLSFDYIWQDPFSPKKNPELWTSQWFKQLKALAKPKVVLMTYSVARGVRDALEEAGWAWQKLSAPGKKRHWLKAELRNENLARLSTT